MTRFINGFVFGHKPYVGTVKKIKNNAVVFEVSNEYGDVKEASFFVSGSINPYQIFRKGDKVPVLILKSFCKERRKEAGVVYEDITEVIPQTMPTDEFIATHPVGSTVKAKVLSSKKGKLIVELAPNVQAAIDSKATGTRHGFVNCRIKSYNAPKKCIKLWVI